MDHLLEGLIRFYREEILIFRIMADMFRGERDERAAAFRRECQIKIRALSSKLKELLEERAEPLRREEEGRRERERRENLILEQSGLNSSNPYLRQAFADQERYGHAYDHLRSET